MGVLGYSKFLLVSNQHFYRFHFKRDRACRAKIQYQQYHRGVVHFTSSICWILPCSFYRHIHRFVWESTLSLLVLPKYLSHMMDFPPVTLPILTKPNSGILRLWLFSLHGTIELGTYNYRNRSSLWQYTSFSYVKSLCV